MEPPSPWDQFEKLSLFVTPAALTSPPAGVLHTLSSPYDTYTTAAPTNPPLAATSSFSSGPLSAGPSAANLALPRPPATALYEPAPFSSVQVFGPAPVVNTGLGLDRYSSTTTGAGDSGPGQHLQTSPAFWSFASPSAAIDFGSAGPPLPFRANFHATSSDLASGGSVPPPGPSYDFASAITKTGLDLSHAIQAAIHTASLLEEKRALEENIKRLEAELVHLRANHNGRAPANSPLPPSL